MSKAFTEDTCVEKKSTVVHSTSIYFDDGDMVVFSKPEKDVTTAFKIYRSSVTCLSLVFKAMFSLPQADNVEKYDGVPFVHTFDMAQDLEHLFEVIYMRR